jgi:uncharacterized protein YuzE
MSQDFDYDPTTDSLYVKVRLGESVDNRILGDDIEHASRHPEVIAEALGRLHQRYAA